jgi:hypothetical protein
MKSSVALAAVAAGLVIGAAPAGAAGPKQAGRGAAPATALVFSGAGAAIDQFGGFGPCSAAVAGNGGLRTGGSGSLVVSRGGIGFENASVCAGDPASLRYDVVSVSGTTGAVTLGVRVTSSDAPSIPVGTTGPVTLTNDPNRLDIRIGPDSGSFGPEATVYSGFIATRSDVKISSLAAASVTDFSGTGGASDIFSGFGNCAVAVAGTTTLTADGATVTTTVLDGGGAFSAGAGHNQPAISTCVGAPGSFSVDVRTVTTDGENTATVGVTAKDSGEPATPNGTPGTITIDEPSQTVGAVFPAHSGTFFGPHTLFAGFIDLRAGAEVETRLVGSTPCKVTGGGWILDHRTLAASAAFRSGDAAPSGHVEYKDRSAGLTFSARSVDNLVCVGTHATIVGRGTANGAPVEYRIDEDDKGEPGRADVFEIELSSGYAASGTLSGGNIQVH